jgi:hypothetical protein
MRYLLAYTAVVIITAREYLAADGASPEKASRIRVAFTKSAMLHMAVRTRAYAGESWW